MRQTKEEFVKEVLARSAAKKTSKRRRVVKTIPDSEPEPKKEGLEEIE